MHLSIEQINHSICEIIDEIEGNTVVLWSSKPLVNRYVNDTLITARFIKTPSETKILDLGCGPGVLSLFWRRLGCSVWAVDRKPILRDQAIRYDKEGIKYMEMDLNSQQLPFEDETFDAVLFLMVVEHLRFPPKEVLEEIRRVLKADGYLILQTSNQASLFNRFRLLFGKSIHPRIEDHFDAEDFDEHTREYTADEVKFMIQKTQFETIYQAFNNYMVSDRARELSGIRRFLAGCYLAACHLIPSFRYEIMVVARKPR